MKKMWSKKDLMEYANICAMNVYWEGHATRLNYCQAWYAKDAYGSVLLKSYDTIVGIYHPASGSLYVFDYYSATTNKHVWKFAQKIGAARIVWLYRRSDNIIETKRGADGRYHYMGADWKLNTREARELEANDYRGCITSKWGF